MIQSEILTVKGMELKKVYTNTESNFSPKQDIKFAKRLFSYCKKD